MFQTRTVAVDGISKSRATTGADAEFGLRTLLALRKDPLKTVVDIAKAGEVARLDVGSEALFVIHHPDHVEHVLKTNAKAYRKSRFYDRLKPIFGNGMIVAEGASWKRQRETARPAFSSKALRAISTVAAQNADDFVAEIRELDGQPLDVSEAMMRLTLSVAMRVLYSAEVGREDARRLQDAITVALRTAEKRMWAMFPALQTMPTASTLRFKKAVAVLDDFVYGLVAERRAMGEDAPKDLLYTMLSWRDPQSGKGLPDQIMRDEILFMMLAAHETTAAALAWSMYLLSTHPQTRRQVRDELASVLQGRTPTYDDLKDLKVTEAVISESMRLFPPAWSMSRTALEDDEIGGYAIPAGASLMVCPWLTHRDSRYWDNPMGFDPARFLDAEAEAARHPFAYFPFGGGPRTCIGNNFAMIEAVTVLARVLQQVDLDLAHDATVTPEPMISLRPHGLYMVGTERKGEDAQAA